MGSSIWLLLFFIVHITLHHLVAPTIAQNDVLCTSEAEFCWRCADFSNYINGSIFQQNLISLLSSFSNTSQNQDNYGFQNSSLGQGSNKVNAIALCRGDLGLEDCRSCLNYSTQSLMRNCSYKTEAILWAEPCMVRYSQDLIFGIEDEDPVGDKADSGDSRQKYAAGHATVPGYETIYAHAQCTPDIDKVNCSNCLKNCISALPACCSGKSGARVLKPSCNIRFENNLFYMSTADSQVNIPAPAPAPATPTTPETPSPPERDDTLEEISLMESLQYDFEDIRSATDDFSDENKLGQGGFGAVHKGRLYNGRYIAVKILSKSFEQGDREFKNEVTLVAQLQHRNLVRPLGFCLKGEERLLIYEYIPNTSLDHFIFGGIVRGLLYLHEDSRLRIIHRDLKASNILLDEDMNPKIADFGMANCFGYMALEYASHGRFSVKSDVFSFGVLVLEIIIGKKSSSFQNGENEDDLLSYVWRNWRDDTIPNIIDPLLTTSSRYDIIICIHIGLLCVQENVNDRPTITSVVSMLNSHPLTLSTPS
ncbi:putative protein kinase RLK-Pelle-DLSV family [Rosa chinensis]|uniref:non-specific serine/threonine protein kinase n=1 Tax=Rosa chinensis TaxID=74649 RepID=A0A2P6QAN9_ROSCH|nr:putative protein kinase RLK-Pelle-DLSV family [Rosa chinensis]